MLKKPFIILVLIIFLASGNSPLFAGTMMPDFLCEIGLKFYSQGRNAEALHEFQKALLAQPNYSPALEYIRMIEERESSPKENFPEENAVYSGSKEIRSETAPPALPESQTLPVSQPQLKEEKISSKEIAPPEVFRLDNSLNAILQPIEIEQDEAVIISGKAIQRFLVTEPEMLRVEQQNPDEILVTGKEIGYTYLYVWDINGRWSLEFLTVPPKPEGATTPEEAARLEEEKARDFKLRYTLDWNSYESGRRVKQLRRGSYSWFHSLDLNGPTPYGDLNSGLDVRTIKNSTDLTYFTLGLTNGKIGNFKGFSFRGFDYSVPFSNLAFPGIGLKGAMFSSPAFNQKLDYTVFWGRESAGRYGNLSPSLTNSKDAYYKGVNLNFSPPKQNYRFTLVEGWGEDREDYLHLRGYDLSGTWKLDNWEFGHEVAYDTERFANLFNLRYQQPKVNFNAEFRNIDKQFTSIYGNGWRQGELGGLFNLSLVPAEKLRINSSLNVYRTKIDSAEDNPDRWNEDFYGDANYQIDPSSSAGVSYALQNDLGKSFQSRSQTAGLRYNQKFEFLTDIYTYLNYYHQENKNYSSHISDYSNDKILGGLRMKLIDNLYYYANREFNWLQEKYTGTLSKPNAFETGLDWSGPLGKSKFFGDVRLTYRDERNTESNLSFFSGEDYWEAYSELAYRPDSDWEAYLSCRSRNIWGQDPRVVKRLEMNFNFGLRCNWDTGLHWDSVGNVGGYVFKDFNSNGLKEKDEPLIPGAKIWLGKDKLQITDEAGHYLFKNIKARKAYLSFDTSTLPSGFVLTVPAMQQVNIVQHQTVKADFGIVSRSEISGIVFEDTNGNGNYDNEDKGVQGAVINLEDGSKSITDNNGKYYFSNATPGEHTVTLDLSSLPLSYIPEIPIFKKIDLSEGASYLFNIPLKKE